MRTIRTYSELILLPTFEARYEYLRTGGAVGQDTFGYARILNQRFYRSREWKKIRDFIIVRDNGCDLAMPGHELGDHIVVHHMVDLTVYDIRLRTEYLLDPEYMVCTAHATHNAIHFSDAVYTAAQLTERIPNDTIPWR